MILSPALPFIISLDIAIHLRILVYNLFFVLISHLVQEYPIQVIVEIKVVINIRVDIN